MNEWRKEYKRKQREGIHSDSLLATHPNSGNQLNSIFVVPFPRIVYDTFGKEVIQRMKLVDIETLGLDYDDLSKIDA